MPARPRLSIVDLMPVRDGDPHTRVLADTLACARAAERAGYARYWIAEHHGSPATISAAPDVVAAAIGAVTDRIRIGAGGVMLPNHRPYTVAERIGTLAALYPGRVDLGIGRAAGTDSPTAKTLGRTIEAVTGHEERLTELRGYLAAADPHAPARVRALPGEGSQVPIYVLGSSVQSAEIAARAGLPYAFAAHFAPARIDEAIAAYRRAFRPGPCLAVPEVIVAATVCAAATEERARWEFTAMEQSVLAMLRGAPAFPAPDPAATARWSVDERRAVDTVLGLAQVGTAPQVAAGLADLAARTGADEVMVTCQIWDTGARIAALESLARAWQG